MAVNNWATRIFDPSGAEQAFNAEQAQISRDFNANEALKNRTFNAEQAELNRQFQKEMSSTAYQRARSDLLEAGLNPYLAYSQGGASTPAGSALVGSSASSSPASAGAHSILSDVLGFVTDVIDIVVPHKTKKM